VSHPPDADGDGVGGRDEGVGPPRLVTQGTAVVLRPGSILHLAADKSCAFEVEWGVGGASASGGGGGSGGEGHHGVAAPVSVAGPLPEQPDARPVGPGDDGTSASRGGHTKLLHHLALWRQTYASVPVGFAPHLFFRPAVSC
jgi:hypothetical protein